MFCKIKMITKEDVLRVNRIAAEAGIDMSIFCGDSMIDPRSLLGLFDFMGKEANLVAPEDLNPKYFQKLVKRMGVAA